MHVHKDTELDAECLIHQFSRQNKQAHRPSSPIVPPRMKAGVVTEPMLKTKQT